MKTEGGFLLQTFVSILRRNASNFVFGTFVETEQRAETFKRILKVKSIYNQEYMMK